MDIDFDEYFSEPLLPIGKCNSFDALMAIGCNEDIIYNQLKSSNNSKFKDKKYIRKIAVWSYRFYGFGQASVEEYLLYQKWLNKRKPERLRDIDADKWKEICATVFARDNYTCSYCNSVGGILECDHIIPISKGGNNDYTNLTTSCRKCNRQKKDKSLEEFNIWKSKKSLKNK